MKYLKEGSCKSAFKASKELMIKEFLDKDTIKKGRFFSKNGKIYLSVRYTDDDLKVFSFLDDSGTNFPIWNTIWVTVVTKVGGVDGVEVTQKDDFKIDYRWRAFNDTKNKQYLFFRDIKQGK